MQHVVYAVTEHGPKLHTIRVSEPLDWHTAVNRWEALDTERRLDHAFKVNGTERGVTAARMPVRYFAVRSADDDGWPVSAPLSTVRLNGKRI